MKNKRLVYIFCFLLSLLGVWDSLTLTVEHFRGAIPPCSVGAFSDCGRVLTSSYSQILGVPISLVGLIYYGVLTASSLYLLLFDKPIGKWAILLLSSLGFSVSALLVYLQLVVVRAVCLYCMLSALTSTLLFLVSWKAFRRERVLLTAEFAGAIYRSVLRKIFFRFDAEILHGRVTTAGEVLGRSSVSKEVTKELLGFRSPVLSQRMWDLDFNSPVGMAAGFDYEAKLTQILPSLGFGFQTVGTITNHPYEGNQKPRLGRLVASKSLMVNKGFKNLGAEMTILKLENMIFDFPLGVSIGRTNSRDLQMTQKQSVTDIIQAFVKFENSKCRHSYYELNISCPNLHGHVSFYPPKNLDVLLSGIDRLKIKRPILIKMPINETNEDVKKMLAVIARHCPRGVIFGNLQKNRNHPALNPSEVGKFPVGNFSGRPTFSRSNELISLCYSLYGDRFVIVGCGGIFSASDAWEKIVRGASLVQLITGLVYQGPQLVTEVNFGLEKLVKKNGLKNISEAVGLNFR